MRLDRRQFVRRMAWVSGGLAAELLPSVPTTALAAAPAGYTAADLPRGSAPVPVPLPHFPSRLHALVWRNWSLVPVERIARAVGAKPVEIRRLGRSMGLPKPPRITLDLQRRSALTVIRRNWHLLPYDQLLVLLDWTAEQMAFTLREDDFLYVKLGGLKPRCEPLAWVPADTNTLAREQRIAEVVRTVLSQGALTAPDPLFGFVARLSAAPASSRPALNGSPIGQQGRPFGLAPRFCYSYFALYGDPLLEPAADPYPDGYLARLAAAGVDGVWLQAVLSKLAPFPWDSSLSARYRERLANLHTLVARARKHGIGIYLYLNEPRAMPPAFYARHPELKGVSEGEYATLCSSHPDVRGFLRDAVGSICRAVPDLAGFFTITASENLTNCWSHGGGAACPRCGPRGAVEVIAEVNATLQSGIQQAGTKTRFIVWDWGWSDDWVEGILRRLPREIALMSVSEWDLPLQRGGVATAVGEYSISAIGPGPRAQRHWDAARRLGLRTLAKIQAGNTWELSAVPYIPAVENVARHAMNLRDARVDGLMLGWTLGGYPSPNLEVVAEIARTEETASGDKDASGETESSRRAASNRVSVQEAMRRVAERRYGKLMAPAVVAAWREFSAAFSQFPFHGGLVYNAPMQFGPANLLWGEATGYHATMIGFPYDDLEGWRQVYPVDVFVAQFERVADGFDRALAALQSTLAVNGNALGTRERQAVTEEMNVAEAAAIHFRTTANQARFVKARNALAATRARAEAQPLLGELERLLRAEISLAQRLYRLQTIDSRLGFEASNQYYYVPLDLAEKVLNCQDLLERWLPAQRGKWGM